MSILHSAGMRYLHIHTLTIAERRVAFRTLWNKIGAEYIYNCANILISHF